MSDALPIQNGLKQGDVFITTAFHLCFRICHQEGPRKQGRTGIEWNTSAPQPLLSTDDVNIFGENINIIKNIETVRG
jgi:hypothetical protein